MDNNNGTEYVGIRTPEISRKEFNFSQEEKNLEEEVQAREEMVHQFFDQTAIKPMDENLSFENGR